jgi:hypothetical protein
MNSKFEGQDISNSSRKEVSYEKADQKAIRTTNFERAWHGA